MNNSEAIFNKAKQYIPGGVNSPVRAFGGVGGSPFFVSHAKGAYLYDVDGNQYIDYIGSWGPMIGGHSHPKIEAAVEKAIKKGLSYGAPTEIEVTLAERICQLMPNIEMIRFVNSGTEATMTAIRIARGVTQRNKIIKFVGCYHGHSDALLVQAGSGGLTFNVPNSLGVPQEFVSHTLTAHFNDLESVKTLFEAHGNDIAGIILEPICGNMNFVAPDASFLQGLRQLCDQHAALLIFDEVMTGFRVAKGGAQQLYNIRPDLTTLGKIIGGGMPVGAVGGKKEYMQQLAPLGKIYQAGTLSGNPVAMAAGLAAMDIIDEPYFYETLTEYTNMLVNGMHHIAKKFERAFTTQSAGGMFGFFFINQEIKNLDDVKKCDEGLFKKFFHLMLKEGVYFAPSLYEAGFVSISHDKIVVENTLRAFENTLKKLDHHDS